MTVSLQKSERGGVPCVNKQKIIAVSGCRRPVRVLTPKRDEQICRKGIKNKLQNKKIDSETKNRYCGESIFKSKKQTKIVK